MKCQNYALESSQTSTPKIYQGASLENAGNPDWNYKTCPADGVHKKQSNTLIFCLNNRIPDYGDRR